MAHARFTNSMTRSTWLLPPSPIRRANFVRKFVMNWMMRGVSPADKFLDPTGAFDSRASTSTIAGAIFRKKPKARKMAPFCIRSFIVTIRTGNDRVFHLRCVKPIAGPQNFPSNRHVRLSKSAREKLNGGRRPHEHDFYFLLATG